MSLPPPVPDQRREPPPQSSRLAYAITVVLLLGAVIYGPLIVTFPWMWSGDGPPGLALLIAGAVPPASWLVWHRTADGYSHAGREMTVVLTAAITVAWGGAYLLDLAASSQGLSVLGLAGLVLYVPVVRRALRVWRRWQAERR